MRRSCLLLVFLVLISGCDWIKRLGGLGQDEQEEIAFATKATAEGEADEPPADERRLVPAGELRNERGYLQFAVYALPGAPSDLTALARAELTTGDGYRYLQLVDEPSKDQTRPFVVVEAPPIEEYAPPDSEMLSYFGRGLTSEQEKAVLSSPAVVVMSFVYDKSDALRVHQDALAIAGAVGAKARGLVWDETSREIFSLDAWAERRAGKLTDPAGMTRHFTLHSYRNGELIRMVTLGLEKFALPDIVVNDVPATLSKSMAIVINRVASELAKKGRLDEKGKLAIADVELTIARGERDEGDPDNELIEIIFPGSRDSLHERQNELVAKLVGVDDDVSKIKHNEELEEASERAKKRLLALKPKFSPKPTGVEQLSVKAPFESTEGREWMWVEVVRWEGTKIHGVLDNQPRYITDLKAGSKVEVDEASIFDYILVKADGTREGNETGEIMMRQLGTP